MTRRDAFGKCGLLGLLAGLWPWGIARGRETDPWRDVLDSAFRNVRDDGWVYWVDRKRAEFDSADWARLNKIYRRADGKQVWFCGIEAYPRDEGYVVMYGFVPPPPPITYAWRGGQETVQPYEVVNV